MSPLYWVTLILTAVGVTYFVDKRRVLPVANKAQQSSTTSTIATADMATSDRDFATTRSDPGDSYAIKYDERTNEELLITKDIDQHVKVPKQRSVFRRFTGAASEGMKAMFARKPTKNQNAVQPKSGLSLDSDAQARKPETKPKQPEPAMTNQEKVKFFLEGVCLVVRLFVFQQ